MIKKILCGLVLFFICAGGVKAITPEELNQRIKEATDVIEQCELRLKELNPTLTNLFLKERTNDEGHDAEIALRAMFPKQYMDYIVAKSELDSLLYTQYLIFVNGKAE